MVQGRRHLRNDLTNHAAAVMQLHMTTGHGGDLLIRGISDPENGDSGLNVTRMGKDEKFENNANGLLFPRAFPVWLKIIRQGGQFTGYARAGDNDPWVPVSTPQKLAMGDQIVAGCYICSVSDGNLQAGTFDGKVTDVGPTLLKPEEAVPIQPYPVAVQGGNNSVMLTWAPVDHFGHRADGYVVYKAKAGQTTFTKLKELTGDQTFFLDDQIKNGEEARYQVTTVVNIGGKTLESRPFSSDASKSNKLFTVTGAPTPPIKVGKTDFFASVLDGGGPRPYSDTPGTASYDAASGVVTLVASGWDIQERTDGGEQLVTPVHGDFTLTARLLSLPTALAGDVSTWAKFGLMVRENTTAESRYAAMLITPNHGIRSPHRRMFTNGWSDDVGPNEDTPNLPVTLQIKRVGNTLKFFRSDDDGKTFSPYGTPDTLEMPNLSPDVYVGLMGTAHTIDTTPEQKAQVKFDKLTMTTP